MRIRRLIFLTCAALLFVAAAAPAGADDWVIPRRKDPFPTEALHLILPLPYSLPGIGTGVALIAYETNYYFLHRGYFILITGDAEGANLGMEQEQLLPKRVLFDLFVEQITKATVNNYTLRGMETGKNDYTLLETNKVQDYQGQLTFTAWERRIEAYAQTLQEGVRLVRIRDSKGGVISDFTEPPTSFYREYHGGLRLDFTNEYFDPRRGARLLVDYKDAPRQDASQPDYYTVTTRLNGYLPIWERGILAVSVLQSDARVRDRGDTDLASLNRKNDLGCAAGDVVCQASQAALVANAVAANSNGTSLALGGRDLLRAYPQGRFQGAHTFYFGAELRMYLTEEVTPFDYLFFRDIRTGVQVAPFYEAGSVAETESGLGQRLRSDYGVGLRMVTQSGAVYRVDVANGDEGANTTIIVSYPW